MDFQATLFEPEARSEPGALPGPASLAGLERRQLSRGAWIEVLRNWVGGADEVFDALAERAPWRAERRVMYDRVVDVPRLVAMYGDGDALPHPALVAARDSLSEHYLDALGEPFVTAGCCYYRDGRDSVAWHGDTGGRASTQDTMVAILSFGDPRKLCLRPRGGGASRAITLGHGDLLVMGGSCQRTWEHAVPKTARAGPRISAQFRPRGVF